MEWSSAPLGWPSAVGSEAGILGDAIMVATMNVPEAQEDRFNAWYSHEHLPERLRVPGIHRARRYQRSIEHPGPGLRYFTIYEAASTSVFSSGAYLDQLDSPTKLTEAVIQGRKETGSATGRAVMSVLASSGRGVGRQLTVLEHSPAASERDGSGLQATLFPMLLAHPEICAVHLASGDADATNAKSQTKDGRTFGETANFTSHLLLVEGTHRVRSLFDELVLGPGERYFERLGDATSYDLLLTMEARR